jgi:hypothetical protein
MNLPASIYSEIRNPWEELVKNSVPWQGPVTDNDHGTSGERIHLQKWVHVLPLAPWYTMMTHSTNGVGKLYHLRHVLQ